MSRQLAFAKEDPVNFVIQVPKGGRINLVILLLSFIIDSFIDIVFT